MTTNDGFERACKDWFRGIQRDAQVQRGNANLTTLIMALLRGGHSVVYVEYQSRILIDANTSRQCVITMQGAREMDPETLLQWVRDYQQPHTGDK